MNPETPQLVEINKGEFGPRSLIDQKRPPRIKPAKVHGKYSYVFWIISALFIGIFTASFAVSASAHLVSTLFKTPSNDQTALAVDTSVGTTTDKALLGSNDSVDATPSEDSVSLEPSDEGLLAYIVSTSTSKSPQVTSKEYLVGDMDTGQILLQKNSTTTYPIASVSKLMTILVARQLENLHDTATISKFAISTYGTQGELKSGQQLVVGDLTYPLLLESSNDAAEAFAEVYGRDAFLQKMNQKAAAIGMSHTSYSDPSGLTPKNVSTAQDLFKLARHIKSAMPEIYDITRAREYSILGHTWTNHNHFLSLSSFVGGKNGYTDEALNTTVSLFNLALIPGSKDTHTVVIVLLQSKNREADVYTLLSYLKNYVSLVPTATSTISQ